MLYVTHHKKSLKIPKGLIRSHQSNKTQYNGQKTNNDLQHTTQKTKDWATRTPLKTGDEHIYSGKHCSSCSTSGTRHVII